MRKVLSIPLMFFVFSSLSFASNTEVLVDLAGPSDGDSSKSKMYLSEVLVADVLQAKNAVEQGLQGEQSIGSLVAAIRTRLSSSDKTVAPLLVRTILEVNATMSLSLPSASDIVRAVEVYCVRQYQIVRIDSVPQAAACRQYFISDGIIGDTSLELSAERIGDILYRTKPELSLMQLIQAVVSYKNKFPPLDGEAIEEKLKDPANQLIDPNESRIWEINRILQIRTQLFHVRCEDILRIFTATVPMREFDAVEKGQPIEKNLLFSRLSLAQQVLAVVHVLKEKGEDLSAREIRNYLKTMKIIARSERTLGEERIQLILIAISGLKEAQGLQKVQDLSIESIYRHAVVKILEMCAPIRDGKEFSYARSFFVRTLMQRKKDAKGSALNEGAGEYITPEHLVAILSAPKEERAGLVWIPELIRQAAESQGMPVDLHLKSTFTSHEIVSSVLAAERILEAQEFITEGTPQFEKAKNIIDLVQQPGIRMDVKLNVIVNVLAARARQPQEVSLTSLVEEFEMLMIQEAKIEALNRKLPPNRRLVLEILRELGMDITEGEAEQHFDELILNHESRLTPSQQVKAVMAAQSFFLAGEASQELRTINIIYDALCGDQIKLITPQEDPTSLNRERIRRIMGLAANSFRTPEEVLFQLQLEDVLTVCREKRTRTSTVIRSALVTEGFVSEKDVLSLAEIESIVEAMDKVQADVAVQSAEARQRLNLEGGAIRPIVNPDGTLGTSLEMSVGDIEIARAAERGLRAAGFSRSREAQAGEKDDRGGEKTFAEKVLREIRASHRGWAKGEMF